MDAVVTTDVERMFWAYDRASVANIVVLVSLSGPGVRHAHRLESAALAVAGAHPYLRHSFSSDSLALIPHQQSTVGWRIAEQADSHDWHSVVMEELHAPFDLAELPLVRGIVLSPSSTKLTLIITMAHAISDAVGAYGFVRDVLEEWERLVAGGEVRKPAERRFVRPRTSDFPPIPRAPTWTVGGNGPVDRLQSHPFAGDHTSAPRPQHPAARRSQLETRSLKRGQTEDAHRRARNLGVSLNSLVTAQSLVSLARVSQTGGSEATMRIATAVNLRPLLPQADLTTRDLGLWAGRFDVFALVGKDRGSDRRAKVDAWAQAFQEALVLQRPLSFEALRSPSQPSPVDLTLKLSHHGDFDRVGYSSPLTCAEVTEFRGFTALHRGLSPGTGIGLIPSVFQGRLDLSFVLPGDASDGAWGDAVVAEILEGLSED